MRIRVNVTQEDIDDGIPMEAELPRKATRFINRFDDGDSVDPINFNLDFSAVNYQEF
jgi:hypothetical protein